MVFQFLASQPKPERVVLYLNSTGGDLGSALALYNLIHKFPIPVSTHNIGEVSSSAVLVFLAGSIRYACNRSLFKLHSLTWTFGNQGGLTRALIEDAAATLAALEGQMKEVVTVQTKITKEAVDKYFNSSVCVDAQTALEWGIIHEIKEIY